jgi:hypothetical protein
MGIRIRGDKEEKKEDEEYEKSIYFPFLIPY